MMKYGILIGSLVILAVIYGSPQLGWTGDITQISENASSVRDTLDRHQQGEYLNLIKLDLSSGRPTLAFFYYSVACSCTAARCAIAGAAIDSIPELSAENDSLNFIEIDAYLVPESESLFNVTIVPAVVYFDKDGKEINRLEWGTNREAIWQLITHPEEKQEPLD